MRHIKLEQIFHHLCCCTLTKKSLSQSELTKANAQNVSFPNLSRWYSRTSIIRTFSLVPFFFMNINKLCKKCLKSRKVCSKQCIYRFAFKRFSARRQRAFRCIQLNFDWFSIVLLLRECHAIFTSFLYIVVSLIFIFSIIRTFY